MGKDFVGRTFVVQCTAATIVRRRIFSLVLLLVALLLVRMGDLLLLAMITRIAIPLLVEMSIDFTGSLLLVGVTWRSHLVLIGSVACFLVAPVSILVRV